MNKLTINEQGTSFYNHIKRAFSEIEAAKQCILNVQENPEGELRLLLSSCRRIVTQAIEVCQKRYPNIKFSVKNEKILLLSIFYHTYKPNAIKSRLFSGFNLFLGVKNDR